MAHQRPFLDTGSAHEFEHPFGHLSDRSERRPIRIAVARQVDS